MNTPRFIFTLVVSLFLLVPSNAQSIREQDLRAELGFLASDAMQGRGSGTVFERIAAEYIGSQFRQFGLEPGGDTDGAGNKSFVQRVPVETAPSGATWNVIGILRGSNPSEAIMLSAHLDHLGVNDATPGDDKIFNGADDDGSGSVAVIELARTLAAGKKPRRTIYFVCFGSEERRGAGSRHFIDNPPVPLTQFVADLQFEMLGRPDEKIAAGTLWLTGFERSDLGPALARNGAALVADPHPEQRFFQRSDNYPLALRGVIAHTISSFGLHKDYHAPSDDISKIDFPFMTRSLNSLVRPIRWLADSDFRPAWLPGQAPVRPTRQ
jgi:Zn-dependent M28 family amino/carboxypeptidase